MKKSFYIKVMVMVFFENNIVSYTDKSNIINDCDYSFKSSDDFEILDTDMADAEDCENEPRMLVEFRIDVKSKVSAEEFIQEVDYELVGENIVKTEIRNFEVLK